MSWFDDLLNFAEYLPVISTFLGYIKIARNTYNAYQDFNI